MVNVAAFSGAMEDHKRHTAFEQQHHFGPPHAAADCDWWFIRGRGGTNDAQWRKHHLLSLGNLGSGESQKHRPNAIMCQGNGGRCIMEPGNAIKAFPPILFQGNWGGWEQYQSHCLPVWMPWGQPDGITEWSRRTWHQQSDCNMSHATWPTMEGQTVHNPAVERICHTADTLHWSVCFGGLFICRTSKSPWGYSVLGHKRRETMRPLAGLLTTHERVSPLKIQGPH